MGRLFLLASISFVLVAAQIKMILPIDDRVKFYCGFRNIGTLAQTSVNDPLWAQKINETLPVYFVIHGWTESFLKVWVQSILYELLHNIPSNVCGVEWSQLAASDLLTAEVNSRRVGKYLAQFVQYLGSLGVRPDLVTLIGHSLGAQVAAHCGDFLKGDLGAIFALDPAAPNLSEKRAKYVQVVFTAFGRFIPGAGSGHQHFHMNGGTQQPMCNISDIICSHRMSYEYFLHSIRSENVFEGEGCNWNFLNMFCLYRVKDRMGLYGARLNGSFDIRTHSKPPFSCATIDTSNSSVKLYHSGGNC